MTETFDNDVRLHLEIEFGCTTRLEARKRETLAIRMHRNEHRIVWWTLDDDAGIAPDSTSWNINYDHMTPYTGTTERKRWTDLHGRWTTRWVNGHEYDDLYEHGRVVENPRGGEVV